MAFDHQPDLAVVDAPLSVHSARPGSIIVPNSTLTLSTGRRQIRQKGGAHSSAALVVATAVRLAGV